MIPTLLPLANEPPSMVSRTSLPAVTIFICVALLATQSHGDDPVYSGPQPGEKLVPFQVIAVNGDQAGKQVDPIAATDGKPTLLIFVHSLSRPGVALTRGLTSYATAMKEHGAASGIVWLDDDKAKAEAYLTRAAKSLNFKSPVGVSIDGGEGPGAYGLNRNVELTILIAKDNMVEANYALVQPSVTEGAKIAESLAKLIEQPALTSDAFNKYAYPGQAMRDGKPMARRNDRGNQLRSLMQQLVARDASERQIETAVSEVNKWVGDSSQRKQALVRMCNAISQRGVGGEKAQTAVKDWLAKYENDESAAPTRDD